VGFEQAFLPLREFRFEDQVPFNEGVSTRFFFFTPLGFPFRFSSWRSSFYYRTGGESRNLEHFFPSVRRLAFKLCSSNKAVSRESSYVTPGSHADVVLPHSARRKSPAPTIFSRPSPLHL